jgi:hypothetical protein
MYSNITNLVSCTCSPITVSGVLLGMGRKKKISQLLKKIGSGKDFKPS